MRLAFLPKILLLTISIFIAGFCICPPVYATDLRFVSGQNALKIPFELHQNIIYLRVRINDSEPRWFLFDTGARTILNSRSAQALKLKLQRQKQIYVTGEEKPVNVAFVENVSYTLPNAVLTVSESGVSPFDDIERCTGRAIDGILGHELFSRSVVEIDYRAKMINLYEPRSYTYSGKGTQVSLEMTENNLIFVRANIKPSHRSPIAGRFMIDTGFGNSLLLYSPFVESNNLMASAEKDKTTPVCGIGGETKQAAGTLEKLEISGLKFNDTGAIFTQAKRGNLASTELDGLIGGEIFRSFKIIFDYSRRRMIWESYPLG